MRKINSLFFRITVMLILFVSVSAYGQGLQGTDLSRVKATDISDAQLKSFIERGEKEGISPTEAMEMARARGMSASVANELMQRAQQLQQATSSGDVEQYATREVDTDSTSEQVKMADPTPGPLIFGAAIFSGNQPFEPSMNIPTPVNYILGTGDELVIDIWGATTNLHQLTVSSEGTVKIDNLGPVYVHGLTIEQAEVRIMDKLKQLYRGLQPDQGAATTFARVSLGRVRSIQVTLIGEVRRPGTYTVSSLSTLFNALYKAGGPNAIGSFRQIEVLRNNKRVAAMDIYDMLLHGDQSANIRLEDQDVVRVATIKGQVEIAGQVRRPGLYELLPNETLSDLIEMAGAFTNAAFAGSVRIERNTATEKVMLTVNEDQYPGFTLKNGDMVEVGKILDRFENRVSISGAVWRPGDYELTQGMTLLQLIEKAQGVKPDVFRGRAVVNRLTDDFDFSIVAFDVDEVLQGRGRANMPLQPEDQIIIKSIHDMREARNVFIGGEVQAGGSYQYREGMTLEDLILSADGFKTSASEARIEINRRIVGEAAPAQRGSDLAEVFLFSVEPDLSMKGEASSFELQPNDRIYVRARPDYQVQQSIRIEGQVLFPGEYILSDRNERISDLIERAGGLTSEAYAKGATMLRQRRQLERVETEVSLGQHLVVDEDGNVQNYIGIDLPAILEEPGTNDDLFVRPGDVIRIPSQMQTVKVTGGVLRDSEIRHNDGRRLKYYVNRSGGYSQTARRGKAYVVYANGDVATRNNFLFFKGSPRIEPGAEIVVPEKIEQPPMTRGERISVLSAVVSMTAVVITAISRF